MAVSEIVLRERYKIIQEISRGGMGVVFLAKDLLTNQPVAVKKSFFSGDNSARRAFETEAKLLARLKHEGLPKVLDYFILESNFQALVMDYVEGETLAEILESGKQRMGRGLNSPLVLNWALQILSILKYLHNFDPPIVHRDIKPNNITINAEGKIILLDFGLAKGSSISIVGGMSGYSPIEQVNRTGTDPRSDIYALGTTLFHLLTDDYPITALERFRSIYCQAAETAGNNNDSVSRHISVQRSVAEINPQVPTEISDIIMKAMALMPEDRFQTVEDMKSELALAMRNLESGSTGSKVDIRVNTIQFLEKHPSLLDDEEEFFESLKHRTEAEKIIIENNDLAEARPEKKSGLNTTVAADLIFENNLRNPVNDRLLQLSPTEFSGESAGFLETEVLPQNTSPDKRGKKSAVAVLGGFAITLVLGAAILAWYLLVPATSKSLSVASPTDIAVVSSTEKPKNPLDVSIFRSGKNDEKVILNENYQFAVREKFQFLIKSPKDGFLYIISLDNQSKASLAYPKPDQKNNYLKANAETIFPLDNTFEFTEDTPSEIRVFFVVVPSREVDLAKRISATLNYGVEKSTAADDVGKLFAQLDEIAKDSFEINQNSTDINGRRILVKVTKIQRKQ